MAIYPQTDWSSVTRIREANPEVRRELIATFLTAYLTPMRTHVVTQYPGINTVDQDDLLQDFVTSHILQKKILERADQAKGRLRSLLSVSLNNHIKTWFTRRRRDPLYGAADLVGAPPPDEDSLNAGFNLVWAKYVMSQALGRFKDDCYRSGDDLCWAVFELRLLHPAMHGTDPVPYQELAVRFDMAPRQLENQLTTAKRRFGRILRDIVDDYTASAEEREEEIAELRSLTSLIATHASWDMTTHA